MASETTSQKSFCSFQAQASVTKEKNALWVSPEHFNGMNHAPTIQHVCRGEKELFFLEMNWDDGATQHTGALIAFSSSSTMPISSPKTDPDFKLLDSDIDHPDQIRISIDGKIIIFDEGRNQFAN